MQKQAAERDPQLLITRCKQSIIIAW